MTESDFVKELINRFQIEFKKNDGSGIYGLTQKMLAYNSNKIEGSTLTEKQTGGRPWELSKMRAVILQAQVKCRSRLTATAFQSLKRFFYVPVYFIAAFFIPWYNETIKQKGINN